MGTEVPVWENQVAANFVFLFFWGCNRSVGGAYAFGADFLGFFPCILPWLVGGLARGQVRLLLFCFGGCCCCYIDAWQLFSSLEKDKAPVSGRRRGGGLETAKDKTRTFVF